MVYGVVPFLFFLWYIDVRAAIAKFTHSKPFLFLSFVCLFRLFPGFV
jgi:hypothetical protein